MERNSTRFLNAFVEVERIMKRELKIDHASFSKLVAVAAKKNVIIKKNQMDLIDYAQLRNAIVHSRVGYEEVIAEPHLEVVEHLESIAKQLTEPKRIREVIQGKVYCADIDDDLKEIIKTQEEKNYSVVPVYDGERYVGILHSRLYQRYLGLNANEIIDLNTLSISEVLKCDVDDERVMFVSSHETILEVVDRYERLHDKGKALIAILITEDGKLSQPPLHILTAVDMPKLIRELE